MNIHQKLLNVRRSVPFLSKDESGPQYSYLSAAAVLAGLRAAMDEQGLLLIPRVIGKELREYSSDKGTQVFFTELKMHFTWVNVDKPTEMIKCPWYTQGIDYASERGVGKALTYAEKYFLLKFFNIPTEKSDDPDASQGKISLSTPPESSSKDSDYKINKKQISLVWAKTYASGLGSDDKDATSQALHEVIKKRYGIESVSDMTNKHLKDFLEYIDKV